MKYINHRSRNINQFKHFDETYQDTGEIKEEPGIRNIYKKPLKSFLRKASQPLLKPFSKSNAQFAKGIARSLLKFTRDF